MIQEMARKVLPDDWEVLHESALICPHGHTIEWDGECPDGCESPLRQRGLI